MTGGLYARFAGEVGGVLVVDRSNLTDVITAIGLARSYGAPVLAIDPKAGLDDTAKAWLDGSSGTIDKAFIVDSTGTIGQEVDKALGGLIAGPLGAAAASNPKA